MSIDLRREAAFYFRCLFDIEISNELVDMYVKAHQKFGNHLELNERTATVILQKKLDPIAIEFSSRKHFKVLKYKLLLLCYLAEQDGTYHHYFVNDERQIIKAFLKLSFESLKTIWIFLKGKYYIHRYGLI